MSLFTKKKKTFKFGSDKIDVIDKVRSLLQYENIDIPGIMVTGAQSSGKSSLLENLSGIQLPIGETITTRAPLIMKIIKQEELESHTKEIYIGSDISCLKQISEQDIVQNINDITNTLTGNDSSVTSEPILLKIIQNEIPSMTIIDLPGITHISKNDLQMDIHQETKQLVEDYMQNINMVILCVVPAIDDFSNAETIKLAKKYDPEGNRTIGVITKVDICPYDIGNKVSGQGIKMKNGFVAIRNRTPDDEQDISLKNIRKKESSFFEKRYPHLPKSNWGIDTLISKIVIFQEYSIGNAIPNIIKTLKDHIRSTDTKLEKYAVHSLSDIDKIALVCTSLFKIQNNITKNSLYETKCNHFFNTYLETLKQEMPDYLSKDYFTNTYDEVKIHHGLHLPNFMNMDIFKSKFSANFDLIRKTTLNLVENISLLLLSTIETECNSVMNSELPQLTPTIIDLLRQHHSNTFARLYSVVHELLLSEKVIFTQNSWYSFNVSKEIESEDLNIADLRIKSNTHLTTVDMLVSLKCYHDIVINRLSDTIPMIIYKFSTIDLLYNWDNLLSNTNNTKIIDSFNERFSNEMLNEYKNLEDAQQRYTQALTLLEELAL